MPLKCFYKPDREKKRVWTAKTVGQVYCRAIETGTTQAELDKAIDECRHRKRREDKKAQQQLQAMQQAIEALEETNKLLLEQIQQLNRTLNIGKILLSLTAIISLIPPLRPLRVALRVVPVLMEQATNLLTRITVQRAANQAAYQILREAAANEARFLQRAGLR